MQHTTNYNLSQYEAADIVTREDFNADNAKIDAALKTNADAVAAITPSPWVKLADITVEADTASVTFTLPEPIDLSEFVTLHVYPRLIGSVPSATSLYITYNDAPKKSTGNFGTGDFYRYELFPEGPSIAAFESRIYSSGHSSDSFHIAYSYFPDNLLSTITLSSQGGLIVAGSSVVVYGLKL